MLQAMPVLVSPEVSRPALLLPPFARPPLDAPPVVLVPPLNATERVRGSTSTGRGYGHLIAASSYMKWY
jgi:hypothetical protein